MKHFFLKIIVLLSIFSFSSSLSAKVWINELMQSNIDTVKDDLQEFPDSWIELYNDSNLKIDINNWTISLNPNYLNGWKIKRSIVIPPKSYLLIYADKVAQDLHTNFRLDSKSGRSIYLFDNKGRLIDMVNKIPKQPAPNIGYGRISDGNETWAYFVSATPGSKNKGIYSSKLLPNPVFSLPGGIYMDTVYLSLSLPVNVPKEIELSDIHYTLDNSEPSIDSPSYTGEELIISKTTVVRAKLIHPYYLTNRATVHSYIISEKEFSLPVVSISMDESYLWDDEFGIYCEGNGKYGLTKNCTDFPANWNNNWRRPVNFEYFPLDSKTSVLNQLCEVRISGRCSRSNPLKSLIVNAHKRFDAKRFEYDLFSEKPNQEIKSFMLRNSGNDFAQTFFRDAAIQLFMGGKVDIDYQAYQPAIIFLNGNYWGILNLRERTNEDFVLANYAMEDIDVIKNWNEVKAGDYVAMDNLFKELMKPHSDRNYQWIIDQIDINEYINYMILEIFVSNIDFPNNNVVMWRPRQTNGKWRFILKDLDFGLGLDGYGTLTTHNALIFNTETEDYGRKLFNVLLTQESFRKEFYKRFAVYLGDLLHYNSTSEVINNIQKMLEPAMQDHITRWYNERNYPSWHSEVLQMKNWCMGRNVEVYKHLQAFFKLGKVMKFTFDMQNSWFGKPDIFINGVRIRDFGLDGSYFQNEIIDLHYTGYSPYYGWEITKTIDEVTTVETYYKQDLSYQIEDECTSVKIRLVSKATPIIDIDNQEIILSIFDNQLQISNLQLPSEISIYDISGKLVVKRNSTEQSIIIPIRYNGIFIVHIKNVAQTFTQKVII